MAPAAFSPRFLLVLLLRERTKNGRCRIAMTRWVGQATLGLSWLQHRAKMLHKTTRTRTRTHTHTHTHTHSCLCTHHSLTNACRSRRFDLHRPCPLASAGRAGVGYAQQTRCDRGRRWVDMATWVARGESVAGSGPPTATARTARLTRTSTKSGISANAPVFMARNHAHVHADCEKHELGTPGHFLPSSSIRRRVRRHIIKWAQARGR